VHVGGAAGTPPLQYVPFTPGETNAYRAVMNRLYGVAGMSDRHDPASGIKAEHIRLADDWLAALNAQRAAAPSVFVKGIACFDWDRTITTMEGINIRDTERLLRQIQAQGTPGGLAIASRLVHDTFAWHMGGEPRMAALQALMGRLHAGGVDVCIVSSNSLAADPIFQEMVRTQLFPMCPMNFICTRGAPYGKGPVLVAYPTFHQVTRGSDASTAASLMAMGRDPAAAMLLVPEENAPPPDPRPLADADVAGAVDTLTTLTRGVRRANRNRRTTRARRGASRKNRRFRSR